MKNLKKVLSLALALVMAMSLMTTAFAADYADIDDVTYTEAVEVMTAVGVFNGVGGDKFAPDATLDRASAAKLIAYLDLGAEDADALVGEGNVFTDVPADYWAAGYIEYMAAAGYTNGTGNDKFSPKATVTGLEFGKWLLTVLGYNAKVEKMTGASWGINTSKLANSIDLFDGVSEKASANLTREAAAAYCLNALQSTCVYYRDLGTELTLSDGTVIIMGASPAERDNDVKVDDLFANGDGFLQLTEKLFEDDLQKTVDVTDAFGRPAVNWTYGGDFDTVYTASTSAEYTNTIEHKTLYNLFGKTVVDNMKHYEAVTTDATEYYVTVTVNGAVTDGNDNYYVIKNNTSEVDFAKNGSYTEVFKDGKYIDIVVIETFVGKVNGDYNKNTERVNTSEGFILQDTEDQDGFEVSDFVEDDYFLYTKDVSAAAGFMNQAQGLVKAELMTGVVDSYIAGESVVVDGETYYYSKNFNSFDKNAKNVSYKLGETATFVMDGMGNIIAIDALTASTSDNYVYVENVDSIGERTHTVVGNIVNTDGTTANDVTISHYAGVKITEDNYDSYENLADGWYTYTKNGDALKLADIAKAYYAVANGAQTLTKTGSTIIGNGQTDAGELYVAGKANNATIFVIKDKNDAVTVYTGINNVPTITAQQANVPAYFVEGSDGFAKVVYIDMESDSVAQSTATSTSDEVFYVLKQSGKKVVAGSSDDVEYYTLDVLKDGKIVNVDVLADGNATNDKIGSILTDAVVNSDNRLTGAQVVTNATYVDTWNCADSVDGYYVSYSNNVLTLKNSDGDWNKDIVVTDDVVIHVIMVKGCELMANTLNDYEVVTVNASELAAMLNGYGADFAYTAFDVSTTNDAINTIYLTLNQVYAIG